MTCAFFEAHEEIDEMDKGLCHRYPPRACYDPEANEAVTVWSMVDWADWCGEWTEDRRSENSSGGEAT